MRSENVDCYICFIDVFRHLLGWQKPHHVPCRGCLGAILRGLGAYLGQPWGHLVPRSGNLWRTWRLLGSTLGDIANTK